ncbi:MAG: hypothetical protein HYV03_02470 [Deltaproteobacteria bacterium]|nr:hypothetical protein [Deltaproteobacteria bacterium]
MAKSKTVVRVSEKGTNARIEDCLFVVPNDSDRSLVETNAPNTQIIRPKIIEYVKDKVGKRKYLWFFVSLGVLADIVTLITSGSHFWQLIFS